jgi:MFS family permease
LGNAIALSSSMFHGARLLGPAIAGYLVYRVGEGWCFFIDGFSYLAVLISLLRMHIKLRERDPNPPKLWESFQKGLNYVRDFSIVRVLILLTGAVSFFSMTQMTLTPVLASKVLGGGERIYGLLLGASGLGGLCGTIYLASRRTVVGLGRLISATNYLMAAGFLGLAFIHSFPLACLLLGVIGFSMTAQIASSNTIIQTLVDDHLRGRVMSLFAMSFMGMMPMGSLLAGWTAERLGIQGAYLISAAGCLAAAMIFRRMLPRLREKTRPLYIKLGLLAEEASGPFVR